MRLHCTIMESRATPSNIPTVDVAGRRRMGARSVGGAGGSLASQRELFVPQLFIHPGDRCTFHVGCFIQRVHLC